MGDDEKIDRLATELKSFLAGNRTDTTALASLKQSFQELTEPVEACGLTIANKIKLAKMVNNRFAQYKSKSVRLTLPVHYKEIAGSKREFADFIVAKLDVGYACPTKGCSKTFGKNTVQALSLADAFKVFQLDHTYEEAEIKIAARHALDACAEFLFVTKAPRKFANKTVASAAIASAVSAVESGRACDATDQQLYDAVSKFVDLDLLREDLYLNVVIRCASCHNEVNRAAEHLDVDEDRYLLPQ